MNKSHPGVARYQLLIRLDPSEAECMLQFKFRIPHLFPLKKELFPLKKRPATTNVYNKSW